MMECYLALTWWWNRDVKEVVAKRKVYHKPGGNLNSLDLQR